MVAQTPAKEEKPKSRGVEFVRVATYPELHVDGKPFFIHSAAFFYYRIPRDLWNRSLDAYLDFGINTIVLNIPWNWHEPRRGEFDFDGCTNPRRDLRGLLKLISEKGFRLIARPSPVLLDDWRHGGYPEWLLEGSEYRMSLADRLDGRYPPLTGLMPLGDKTAEQNLLGTTAHTDAVRNWLTAVARELAPFSARRSMRVMRRNEKRGEMEEVEIGGPLLFVQLGDDLAVDGAKPRGSEGSQYVAELRQILVAAGVDIPFFTSSSHAQVPLVRDASSSSSGEMGRWFLASAEFGGVSQNNSPAEREFSFSDAATLEFTVESLKTQPAFPPVLIDYQAGWHAPPDDARPHENSYTATLLSSRLLLAHGLHGISYSPLQDSLTPAGFSVPWANRHYRWDAALDVSANRQFRSRAVMRNAYFLDAWAEFLAASHKRADFGVIDPTGSFARQSLKQEDVSRVSAMIQRIASLASLSGLSSELVDPQRQPVEQLLRHPLILLPVFETPDARLVMSEQSQRAIVDYVRRGGTLITFPSRPVGDEFDALFGKRQPAAAHPSAAQQTRDPAFSASHEFGKGRVLELSKDFYSWVQMTDTMPEARARFEFAWASKTLRDCLEAAGVTPAVKFTDASAASRNELLVTQLVTNTGSEPLGARSDGHGFLSVSNLSNDSPAEQSFEILSPRSGSRQANATTIPLTVNLPPRESMLLPLHISLCTSAKSAEKCSDEIVAAGAEFLRAQRDGRTLELIFYVPSRATAYISLAKPPGKVSLGENRAESKWNQQTKILEAELLRGASPLFLRTLRVNLPYTPFVPEKPDLSKIRRQEVATSVLDVVKLPLASDVALMSDPPLVVLDENLEGRFLVEARNLDQFGRDLEVTVSGPVRGDGWVGMDAGETRQFPVRLKSARDSSARGNGSTSNSDGLLSGQIEFHSGKQRQNTPISFVVVKENVVTNYRYDLDRDGALEWILENTALRCILSPESGGSALALVDKSDGGNFFTSVGSLRDHFISVSNTPESDTARNLRAFDLFNRSYQADWISVDDSPALHLKYFAPDVSAAGASIEKTVRVTGSSEIRVDYRVEIPSRSPASAGPAADSAKSFVSVNSVPVSFSSTAPTQFCYGARAQNESDDAAVSSPEQCQSFSPASGEHRLPSEANFLVIRNPGRAALRFEWDSAQMIIDVKNFSALLKLQFPPLAPGGAAGEYSLHLSVEPAP